MFLLKLVWQAPDSMYWCQLMSRTGMLLVEQACSDRASPSDRVTAERCVYKVLYSYTLMMVCYITTDGVHGRYNSVHSPATPSPRYIHNNMMPLPYSHQTEKCERLHAKAVYAWIIVSKRAYQLYTPGQRILSNIENAQRAKVYIMNLTFPPHPRLQQICRW